MESPHDYFVHANGIAEAMNYLPNEEAYVQPTDIEEALYIKGNLEVHRVIRKKNQQGVNYLELSLLSFDEQTSVR